MRRKSGWWVIAKAALVALLATGLGVAVPTANGEATGNGWTSPTGLSRPFNPNRSMHPSNPSAVVLPNGTALVAWSETWTDGDGRILVACKRKGRPWASRMVYRAHGPVTSDPQMGVDRLGRVTMTWSEQRSVRAMRRAVGGDWTNPVKLSTWSQRRGLLSQLRLAVGADGTVLVAFWRGHLNYCDNYCSMQHVIGEMVVRPAGHRWTAATRFEGPVGVRADDYFLAAPQAVAYGAGNVSVAWTDPYGPVYVRAKRAGHPWGRRHQLTPRRAIWASDPVMAATSWGQVTVAWSRSIPPGSVIESRTRVGVEKWGSRQTLDLGERVEPQPPQSLVVDQKGEATLLMIERWPVRGASDRFNEALVTWTRSAGRGWAPSAMVDRHRFRHLTDWTGALQLNSSGTTALVVWRAKGQLSSRVHDGGGWSRTMVLDASAGGASAAGVNDSGTAVASWFHQRSSGRYILTAATRR